MKYFCIVLIFLTACGIVIHAADKDPKLISSTHEFVMTRNLNDFTYYHDHENFIRKYFSVRYEEQRIVVTTLMNINCMDSMVGKIDVSNDTIYLKNEMEIFKSGDRLCPELHKFTFIISNPENKAYKIVSTE